MRSASAWQVILAQPSRHRRLGGILNPALCLGADLESVSLPSRRASVSECVSFRLSLMFPAAHDTKHRLHQQKRVSERRWDILQEREAEHPPPCPQVHRWRVTRGTQFRGAERSTCCLLLSCVQLPATPWTGAHQAPLSMGVSRQEHWSGLLCCPPGDLPDPGMEQSLLRLLRWRAGSSPLVPPGKCRLSQFCCCCCCC